MSIWQSILLVIDVVNIACGYLSFLLLGWQTLEKPEKKGFWRIVLLHAGLLDDDVGRRLARGLAAVAQAASLGKDAAPAASDAGCAASGA